MEFLTVEQIKAYCRNELPTIEDEFYEIAGEAAEATLRDETMRSWLVASGSSSRPYVPTPGTDVLRIHDAVSVSAVVENGVTLASSDYQLEPVGGRSISGEVVPYTQIRLVNGLAWYTDRDKATVSVTGSWGWASIPWRIKEAGLIIAKEIVQTRDDVKLGIVDLGEIGAGVARMDRTVRATIQRYRRAEAWGVG